MLIRKLDKNTYDVFGDVGFDQWTRVRRFHWGLKGIAGAFLPRPLMSQVAACIDMHPAGSIDNIATQEVDHAVQTG